MRVHKNLFHLLSFGYIVRVVVSIAINFHFASDVGGHRQRDDDARRLSYYAAYITISLLLNSGHLK